MLTGLPAISLEGPKGVGKTATAQRRAATVVALDDAAQRTLLRAHPQRIDRAPGLVLVDEWQREPAVWDAVRRSVDRDPSPARFLLTGSATPTTAPTHSGAGRGWLAAYAAAAATTSWYNAILDAAAPGESNKPAKNTTTTYRDVLSQLWLLDPVPGWLPSRRAFSRLGSAPKHHLADPALAARLLGVDVPALLDDSAPGSTVQRPGPLLGALSESLVTLSVRVYAQAAEATLHHLRTWDGRHEVDLIVQRADQRIVAFGVKLSPSVSDEDVVHLNWLREQLGDDLLDAVVVTTGPEAYRRADGVAVVPLCLLGP